ncbi:MAG: hypothetical protein AMQ74_01445 [Candidatus Methanofastidiosum methylothiophilum]|uniref:Uncharacterized protein n=1 Tax=Candidatus Methanofastidiosum methylothiophilum TaxID=1705564 RepID=A0A150IWK0_9EURY|nr:MAG: hypothetical protein AMQ74_01445 [Candidatus Methanofastidiosum methylthiophilus]
MLGQICKSQILYITFIIINQMKSDIISIPEDIKLEMEKFSDINWSEIVKNAIIEKISFLEEMEKSLDRSALTIEDTIILGKKVNKSLRKHYKD